MSEQKKMRIGIIGAGSIAHSAHFPVFSSFEDVEVAAVMNRTYEKAEQACRQYGFGKAVKTFDEFLNQDLDAAVLLTPKTVRKEYLVPLLEAKLDVLIEKPLASTMEECEYLAEASKNSGRIVMVAFNRRYSPVFRRGLDEFKDKAPHYVLAHKCREFKEYRATLENSIHMVDMLRYALGECGEVTARAKWSDRFYEDLCTAQLEFENGSLKIVKEGREKKFIDHVEQITFSGAYANKTGQPVLYITERAVFELRADGVYLTEVAPGIDIQTQIIDLMGFVPKMDGQPKLMDARIFKDELMGLGK